MGMEPAATWEERERKTAGWVDEGGELAAAHLLPAADAEVLSLRSIEPERLQRLL
jgi:hypothetical protein